MSEQGEELDVEDIESDIKSDVYALVTEIKILRHQIDGHKSQIAELQQRIELIEETKTALTGQVMDQQREIAELHAAIEEMSTDPAGDYYTGLACGVEDRDILDRYEAAEYGWKQAFRYVESCAPIPQPKGYGERKF